MGSSSDSNADGRNASLWKFGDGLTGTFGFSDAQPDGSPANEPHLPQPLWFKDFAADSESEDTHSMLNLYRMALDIRQRLLTATGNTAIEWMPAYEEQRDHVIAYSRLSSAGGRMASITNFGETPIRLPEGKVLLTSESLTEDGLLPQDTTAWVAI